MHLGCRILDEDRGFRKKLTGFRKRVRDLGCRHRVWEGGFRLLTRSQMKDMGHGCRTEGRGCKSGIWDAEAGGRIQDAAVG